MSEQIDKEAINGLLQNKSSKKIFIEALEELSPHKVSHIRFLVLAIFTISPSIYTAWSNDTLSIFVRFVEILNTITIGLFGIVFMGYAFFQALIKDELLILLLAHGKKDGSKDSKLQESNEYFIKIMMLDIFAIMLNAILLINLSSLDSEFHISVFSYCINNILCLILIFIYLNFSLHVIWEMKSFVFNSFNLFNLHAASRAHKINEESDEINNGN